MNRRIRGGVYFCILFCGLSFGVQGYAQIPLADLRSMAGPWECRDGKGEIHGISLKSRTEVRRSVATETIEGQTLDLRVYQVGPSGENWGYYSLNSRSDMVSKLEGRHLLIDHLLDLYFDPDKLSWKGAWALCGNGSDVVLHRPLSDSKSLTSPLLGDWQGVPGNSSDGSPLPLPEASSLLHIRQVESGRLIGWAEWFNGLDNETGAQTYGDELVFSSSTPASFNFELATSARCASCSVSVKFEGSLSTDGKEIVGKWLYFRLSLVRVTSTSYQKIR